MEQLIVTSSSFTDQGNMPKRNTGFGEDLSPDFHLEQISDRARSIAIIMEDLDIPGIKSFTHWIIWNIPVVSDIPEGIAAGAEVSIGGFTASQGTTWGKNRYRGPKQPFFVHKAHRYIFHIYTLNSNLPLPGECKKRHLQETMADHILQHASITGVYKP